MKVIITVLLAAFAISSCDDYRQDTPLDEYSRELVPEPDTAERLRYEALQRLENSSCLFLNPDTSILSLKIRDAESGKKFIRNDKPGSQDEYRYYSSNFRQLLSLTQHPGDGKYQISIFRVEYAKKDDYGYRKLEVGNFKTEKGIMLGMSKSDVIEKLGRCYAVRDSTEESIELYYKIESLEDTKAHLLANHHMPIYFASYKIRNGGLEMFEFGFEYP